MSAQSCPTCIALRDLCRSMQKEIESLRNESLMMLRERDYAIVKLTTCEKERYELRQQVAAQTEVMKEMDVALRAVINDNNPMSVWTRSEVGRAISKYKDMMK